MSIFGITVKDGSHFETEVGTGPSALAAEPVSAAPLFSPDGVPADTRVAAVARKGGLHKARAEGFQERRKVEFNAERCVRLFERGNVESREPLQLPDTVAMDFPTEQTKIPEGSTPLHLAILRKDLCQLRTLVPIRGEHTCDPVDPMVDAVDVFGMTPLRVAVKYGLRQSARRLINHGKADVNRTCPPLQNTVLHEAVELGDLSMVRSLVYCGADKTKTNAAGHTPLDLALRAQQQEIYDFLAAPLPVQEEAREKEAPADVNRAYTPLQNTLLHQAVELGDLRMVRSLVYCGADKTKTNAAGHTPLDLALRAQQQEIYDFLAARLPVQEEAREKEAPVAMLPPHWRDAGGGGADTGLMHEDSSLNPQFGHFLPIAPQRILPELSQSDQELQMAWISIYTAAHMGKVGYVIGELQRYPEYKHCSSPISGDTLCHAAARGGQYDMAKYLVSIVPPEVISQPNKKGETPWQLANQANHFELADLLWKGGLKALPAAAPAAAADEASRAPPS